MIALLVTRVLAFHGAPKLPHQFPHPVVMAADPPPPELDERQAAFMKARGFTWNAKTRSWIQGDPQRARRLECRSSARVLRWNGDQQLIPDATLTTIREATTRFETALREARQEAIGKDETDKKIAHYIKDKIGEWKAPLVWLAVQVAIFAYLFESLSPPLLTTDFGFFLPAAIGLAFAPLLSSLRRERWVRQPGVEDGDGALERLLVDAALDSYALPAPFEWRASEPTWRICSLLAESIAQLNMVTFWHGGLQAGVVGAASGPLGDAPAAALGIVIVACSAVARAVYFYEDVLDGIPAELETAERLRDRAESYYGMTATSEEEAAVAIRTTRAMADGWLDKFGIARDAKLTQLTLSFVSAALCGVAFELSGRSILGPSLALAFAAVDTYVLRPDPELTRVTLELDI